MGNKKIVKIILLKEGKEISDENILNKTKKLEEENMKDKILNQRETIQKFYDLYKDHMSKSQAGFFFLGLKFGQNCKAESDLEALNWIKRNFPEEKHEWLIKILSNHLAKKDNLECSICRVINDSDAKFCKGCGKKLTKQREC